MLQKIDKLMGKMWWNWTKNGHNVLTKSDLFLAHKRSTSNQKEQYELLIRMCPKCCKMIAKLRFEKLFLNDLIRIDFSKTYENEVKA